MDLNLIRDKIDVLDKEIVNLLEERFELVKSVADYKRENNMAVLDANRESRIIEKNIGYLENKDLSNLITKIFKDIFQGSRDFQEDLLSETKIKIPMKIGYQGVKGSYSEEAALGFFEENNSFISFEKFEDVFRAIENQDIEYGVIPLENSSTGGINENIDLLNKYGLYIVGEEYLSIRHNLMGLKGSNVEDIETVYSHPQAISQCQDFLENYNDWTKVSYLNTAKSAEFVKNNGHIKCAAIASKRAANIYGLEILKSNISDVDNNTTRFVIVGSKIENDSSQNKISIVLSTLHKSGSLFKVIENFSRYDINMLKIQSRPIKSKRWEYFFFIDFEGNLADDNVQRAISNIKENCIYFKVIGNYEKGNNADE